MNKNSVFNGFRDRKQKNKKSAYVRAALTGGFRIVCVLLLLIAVTAAQVFAAGSTYYDFSDETSAVASADQAETAEAGSSLSPEELLETMTLQQKIEQMIMPSVRDEKGSGRSLTELTPAAEKAIKEHCFCGYLFFPENCKSIEQVTRLTAAMQQTAVSGESSLQIPLFLSIRQESGIVERLAGTLTPGNLALGASGDASLAVETAKLIGGQMARAGFNANAAPILDLGGNTENLLLDLRSFGDDPQDTAEMGAGYIRGLHEMGCVSIAGPFPDAGGSGTDRHTGLPIIRKTMAELEESDLIPFRRSIEEGTDMIMTAHVEFSLIEQDTLRSISNGEKVHLPATLSDDILTGILREKLGYDGVIITDEMQKEEITSHFDLADAAQLSINAGADILLSPGDITTENHVLGLEQLVQELVDRTKKGAIQESTVNDAALRILKLKEKRGILGQTASWQMMSDMNVEKRVAEANKYIAGEADQQAVKSITEKTTTLLKNQGGTLPVTDKKTVILCPDARYAECVKASVEQLEKDGIIKDEESVRVISFRGLKSAYAALNVSGYDYVAAITSDDSLNSSGQTLENAFLQEAMNAVHKKEGKFILISSGLPYDTALYQEADAILAAYGASPADGASAYRPDNTDGFDPNLPAAVGAVFGSFVPSGSLPVDIRKRNDEGEVTKKILYKNGFGIQNWNIEKVHGKVRKAGASRSSASESSDGKEEKGGKKAKDGSIVRVLKEFPEKAALMEIMFFRILLF